MSEKEKRIVEKLKNAIPNMSEFDKGYILGNVISGYPDGNDHAISALRYAYEPLFNRRGYSA